MTLRRYHVLALVIVALLIALALLLRPSLAGATFQPDRAFQVVPVAAIDAVPTPGSGAETVYSVYNGNTTALAVLHTFKDAGGNPVYQFEDSLPPNSNNQYHVADMAQIPSPFSGTVVVSADQQFTASVIGYDYPDARIPTLTPTPIVLPTATRTSTPTPTRTVLPTATPTPSGSDLLGTFQVASGADDVNEDGTTFTAGGSTVWIGNASSTTAGYTGVRFQGVIVPRGAVITSAHLDVYQPAASWISTSLVLRAEASGNSAAFSTTSKPSQRTLGTMSLTFSDGSQWLAGTWHSLGEMPAVVQEVVNRADWQSGNALSLVLKGSGGTWARKFVTSYEGSAANAPRLTVTWRVATTPTPTRTVTSTPAPTTVPTPPTPTFTPTLTATPSPTATYTATPTATATATDTPSPTPTNTPTLTPTVTPSPTPTPPAWDVNGDYRVDVADVEAVDAHWLETGPPGWIRADVNQDGVIDSQDLVIVALHWRESY
jgi:hypothetical protein